MDIVVVDDGEARADGRRSGDRLLVASADLQSLLGWELKAEGLCRGDACVPARGLDEDGCVDVAAAARALGRTVVVDPDEGYVALAGAARTEHPLDAPDAVLSDLEGEPVHLRDVAGGGK